MTATAQHQTLQPVLRHQVLPEQSGSHWLDANSPITIMILFVLFGLTFAAASLKRDG
ncbi:MAG: hypothetical protein F6J87_21580 [Spirulina sp. SIO3F2]|nr:hypothetical protein [Spirulina sp. SIO3F2]